MECRSKEYDMIAIFVRVPRVRHVCRVRHVRHVRVRHVRVRRIQIAII